MSPCHTPAFSVTSFYSIHGQVPKRPKGTDCKSVVFGLRGFKSLPAHFDSATSVALLNARTPLREEHAAVIGHQACRADMQPRGNRESWGWESHPQPPVYKTGALLLSYPSARIDSSRPAKDGSRRPGVDEMAARRS